MLIANNSVAHLIFAAGIVSVNDCQHLFFVYYAKCFIICRLVERSKLIDFMIIVVAISSPKNPTFCHFCFLCTTISLNARRRYLVILPIKDEFYVLVLYFENKMIFFFVSFVRHAQLRSPSSSVMSGGLFQPDGNCNTVNLDAEISLSYLHKC